MPTIQNLTRLSAAQNGRLNELLDRWQDGSFRDEHVEDMGDLIDLLIAERQIDLRDLVSAQPAQVDQMIDPNEPADYHRGWKDGYKHGAWAAQPAPGAWQPIETAPRPSIGADGFGKRLLLVVDSGPGTTGSVRKGYWEESDWYLDDCMGLAKKHGYRATHWQPLPAPPAAHSAGNATHQTAGDGE